jgi:mRNA-degrading endonuclease RelE of RelBE toxin-antitoxin system
MLKLRKLYSDRQFDIYAIDVDDRCFVEDFIKGLQESARKKIVRLLSNTAKNGTFKNEEKFKKLHCKKMDIYEFKSKPYRILCTFDGDRKIILSHGLEKCKNAQLKREIERAVDFFKQYFEGN